MADHLLHLLDIDHGSVSWNFTCEHADDDQRWWPVREDGTPDTTIDGERCTYCWLWSWWDAAGAENLGYIDFDGQPVSFPLPVRPDFLGTWGDAFVLVRDDEQNRHG